MGWGGGQRLQPTRRSDGTVHTYGTMGVDWEERVRFDRLREERLARIKALLAESDLGALLCFDMTNIRYITATHIGTWAQDKLNRFCLLPQGDEPIMWDFGSAARHHQLYNPWLGDGRSRAGISTLRGAMSPRVRPRGGRRAEDPRRARAARAARRAGRRRRRRAAGAVRAPGRGHPGRRRPAADAAGAHDQDPGRDHAAQHAPARWSTPPTRSSTARCARACARTSASALVNKVLYDLGSEYVEGVNAISGERCNPHPHVYTDRMLRPGDPAYFDILHASTATARATTARSRSASASRALVDAYKRCRYYLDAAIALIRPGVTTAEVVSVWPRGAGVRLPRRGGGVRAAVRPRRRPRRSGRSRSSAGSSRSTIPRRSRRAWCSRWRRSGRRRDGWSAARIEEQLVVTADGCEVITRFPAEDLVIAGKPLLHGRRHAAAGARPAVEPQHGGRQRPATHASAT